MSLSYSLNNSGVTTIWTVNESNSMSYCNPPQKLSKIRIQLHTRRVRTAAAATGWTQSPGVCSGSASAIGRRTTPRNFRLRYRSRRMERAASWDQRTGWRQSTEANQRVSQAGPSRCRKIQFPRRVRRCPSRRPCVRGGNKHLVMIHTTTGHGEPSPEVGQASSFAASTRSIQTRKTAQPQRVFEMNSTSGELRANPSTSTRRLGSSFHGVRFDQHQP